MLFIDLRQLTIRSEREVERIKAEVERRVRPLGHAVYAIVNYRGCRVDPSVIEIYRQMVRALEQSCYLGVTRYGMLGRLAPVGSGQSEMLAQPAA
jgi:propionate CoA-transferase